MLITIARECGSNAQEVGALLAARYQIALYGREALVELAKAHGIYERMPNFFAENPVSSLLYAIASGEGMARVGQVPLDALRQAIGQQDGVILGRCGNVIFSGREDCVRVFLHGDETARIARLMQTSGLSERQARELVHKKDADRAAFHKYYTGQTWGMAQNYDICLDAAVLGPERTQELIAQYIECRKQAKRQQG